MAQKNTKLAYFIHFRLLHILGDSFNHVSLSYKHSSETFNEKPLGQQSVLELVSVINCLVQDLNTSLIGEMQSLPVLQFSCSVRKFNGKTRCRNNSWKKYAIQGNVQFCTRILTKTLTRCFRVVC